MRGESPNKGCRPPAAERGDGEIRRTAACTRSKPAGQLEQCGQAGGQGCGVPARARVDGGLAWSGASCETGPVVWSPGSLDWCVRVNANARLSTRSDLEIGPEKRWAAGGTSAGRTAVVQPCRNCIRLSATRIVPTPQARSPAIETMTWGTSSAAPGEVKHLRRCPSSPGR